MSTPAATAWCFRAGAWLFIAWLLGWSVAAALTAAAAGVHLLALLLHRLRSNAVWARVGLSVALAGLVLATLAAMWPAVAGTGSVFAPGLPVLACLAAAYLVDVVRGKADPSDHLAGVLYVLQWPVIPAGPLLRVTEFRHQLWRADLTMAGFSYGVRRVVQGLTKVYLVAGPLGSTADQIFALRVTKLSVDAAWLGAVCGPLATYFFLSGFTDIGIGLGKMIGFRHQENFRRPFTAPSVHEFWRCWNVTLATWLRDYFALPAAGHTSPTVRRLLLTTAGFIVAGAWIEPSVRVVWWAVYFAVWLAAEALWFERLLARAPRAVRHAYVLAGVLTGWLILRASGAGPLLGYVEAMLGLALGHTGASLAYLTWDVVAALVAAVVFAGPMVGNLSRWRVSVDAATASLLMMLAATAVLLWHGSRRILRIVWGGDSRRAG